VSDLFRAEQEHDSGGDHRGNVQTAPSRSIIGQ
jgi:hypothetical protein